MFSLLETILGVIVLIFVLYFIIKYPNARIYVFSFLGICLTGLTVYSIINLDYYYSVKGGLFGYISGIFETNKVAVDNLEFSIKNIEMLKVEEDSDTYIAKVYTSESIAKLTVGEEYIVYVNGVPCNNYEYASDYVLAKYTYSFCNEYFDEILRDTLDIRFFFDTSSTYVQVSTNGGENAVKFWYSYFNKNDCKISILKSEYISGETAFITGDIGDAHVYNVSYIVDGVQTSSKAYLKGTKLKQIESPTKQHYNFRGWSLDGQTVENLYNYKVESDLTFTALWSDRPVNIYLKNTNEPTIHTTANTLVLLPEIHSIQTQNGTAIFSHWEVVGGDMQIQNNVVITGDLDIELVAVYDKCVVRIDYEAPFEVQYYNSSTNSTQSYSFDFGSNQMPSSEYFVFDQGDQITILAESKEACSGCHFNGNILIVDNNNFATINIGGDGNASAL